MGTKFKNIGAKMRKSCEILHFASSVRKPVFFPSLKKVKVSIEKWKSRGISRAKHKI